MADKLLAAAAAHGIDARVAYTYRTCSEQNALYASGISPSPGCRSWHTWGRAIDLHIPGDPIPEYRLLGDLWISWGGVWGGNFSYGDYGHYEWHPGHESVSDFCPGSEPCGAPPWDDDRPAYLKASTWIGLAMAAAGVAGAAYVLRR